MLTNIIKTQLLHDEEASGLRSPLSFSDDDEFWHNFISASYRHLLWGNPHGSGGSRGTRRLTGSAMTVYSLP
eukprot:118471-Prorocentrum_minimum.AAC.1